MKIGKILSWIIGIIIILFVIKVIVQFARSFNETEFYSETLKEEYTGLLCKEEQSNLLSVWNYNSKIRNQISIFDYGKQKKYNIAIYKIPIGRNFSIKNVIIKKSNDQKISAGFVYTKIDIGTFELNYKSGRPPRAKSILFSYNGDLSQLIVKNDSILSYFFRFETFSLSFNGNPIKDFFGKTVFKRLPLEVLFLKRNDAFYLLLMSVNDYRDTMPHDLLYSLVNGNKGKM